MQKSYKNLAKYYDLCFQQKDYQKEVDFILELVDKYGINKESILDVGCGTGTHLCLLKNHFDNLYGVDLNKEILEIAKTKVPGAHFLNAGMSDFKIKEKFDVITSLYSVFNYNKDVDSATKTLQNFHKHLQEKGVVIIALYNERTTDKKISLHVGKDDDTKVAKIDQFRYIPKDKTVKSEHLVLIKDNEEIDFEVEDDDIYRIFDFDEIESMVKESGFSNSEIYDRFSFDKAANKSKFPVLVLRR
ncbi:class I SAM-dependent methyltransferase [Candidatus Dojkabacteria bacterium]|nr:class I SAM-dependent methyltransferase [Candidatus Dojkabacteria bacterium]